MNSGVAEPDEISTFRDPGGSLSFRGNSCVRFIRHGYESEVLDFLHSPIYSAWQKRGDIVATEITNEKSDGFSLSLKHPRFFFPSYPWEWTPGQWLAAAELTLRLCDEALGAGWILKDATPLNILFDGPRPVLVDILSFTRRNPRSPIWLANAQFVRSFLLPLVAHRYLGWPLATSLLRRDGNEPEKLYDALSWIRRLHPRLLWPVTFPVCLDKYFTKIVGVDSVMTKAAGLERDPVLVTRLLRHRVETLRRQVRYATPPVRTSYWSKYQAHSDHYSDVDKQEKSEFIVSVLEHCKPRAVLDVGANTGAYSILAATYGARVVALDTDVASIEHLWQDAFEQKRDILPLNVNIAWPTPAVGWENRENLCLIDRAADKFDLVMLLAVIHHIIVGEQIPLQRIVSLCSRLTRKWLVLEWIPPSDPKFQQLIRGRDDLYRNLSEHTLSSICESYFELLRSSQLSNGRTLFLFCKRAT